MLNFCLLTPKRHILARNRVVWRITRENRFRRLGCWLLEEPGGKKKPSKHFDAQFRAYGEKKPLEGSWLNFCMSVDIHDVITSATFCDDRLRGLGVARDRISRFPVDLRRRPYNTLALPCECVKGLTRSDSRTVFRTYCARWFSLVKLANGHCCSNAHSNPQGLFAVRPSATRLNLECYLENRPIKQILKVVVA